MKQVFEELKQFNIVKTTLYDIQIGKKYILVKYHILQDLTDNTNKYKNNPINSEFIFDDKIKKNEHDISFNIYNKIYSEISFLGKYIGDANKINSSHFFMNLDEFEQKIKIFNKLNNNFYLSPIKLSRCEYDIYQIDDIFDEQRFLDIIIFYCSNIETKKNHLLCVEYNKYNLTTNFYYNSPIDNIIMKIPNIDKLEFFNPLKSYKLDSDFIFYK
jgi:hypothetical protein